MTQYEARPTEYKGVVFKSKSEAIVARGFDLAGALWEYEPKRCMVDKYIPDFLVVIKEKIYKSNTIVSYLVEYKPAPINGTYENYLFDKAKKLEDKCSFILLVGSPFNDDGIRTYIPDIGIYEDYGVKVFTDYEYCDWMYSFWEEAKKYRFDLA